MAKVFSLMLILLFGSSYLTHAQLSYEHMSSHVIKYPINDADNKDAILNRFLNNLDVAILFDFENSKDQEYLFEKEFNNLFDRLYDELEASPDKVKTVFFKSVSRVWVDRLLVQARLFDKKYEHDLSVAWPTVEMMVKKQKQLVIFYLDQKDVSLIITAQYNHNSNSFLTIDQVTEPGQLLFLRVDLPEGKGSLDIKLTPKYADSFVEIWKTTGQVPNFILQDQKIPLFQSIPQILNAIEKLLGDISFETEEYDGINWSGDFNAITGSTFCFPAYSGGRVSLVPQSPGYSFEPTQLVFEGAKDKKVNLKSVKKNLSEGTIAYFPFDENMDDLSPNRLKAINHGIEFIEDFNREKVALLDGKYHAKFPQLSDFGMVNQSFTVSAWIKLKSVTEQDQIILSSAKNKYSEGLYMLIRAKKPYLAFYHNDLEGQTVLEVNKWYNIVWRYRKELQQQTIYVNGKLDAVANEHPSFRGGGELNFGYRKNPQGIEHFFDGRIDDLIFWNRALGDSEIRNVYEGNFEFVEETRIGQIIWVGLVAGALVLLAFIFRRRVFNAKSLSEEVQITIPEIDTSRNAVFMFGGLKVLDRDGENITNEITPKLKELFVLLYLSTLKNKKGISSEDLSVGIWPDLSRESAINNRGVSTAKLRQILSKVDSVSLQYNNQFWTLEMDDQVYSDYNVFLDITRKKDIDVGHLSEILKAGNFLPNVSKQWLDSYKFEVSNKIIDIFSPQLEKQWIERNYDLLIEYCEIILTFDVVHETAIKYKIASLKNQKKHEQALKVYQGFANLYQQFYKEEFATQFNDFHP